MTDKIGASPADAGPGCHPFGAEPVPVSGIAGIPDAGHRWSGWPGAWCLDCGCDDPYEIALADGRINTDGADVWFNDPAEEARVRALMVCPEPGSKRHDPYAQAIEAAAAGETRQGLDPKGESAVAEGDAPETPIREASTLARKDGL